MSEIMITLQQIRDQSPCKNGWKKVFEANKGDMTKPFPLKSIIDSNDLRDCLWTLRCLPEHANLWRLYAVWCARQVEHLMTDARSETALDVAERFAKGDATQKELTAARYAASDAECAAIAAWAAIAALDVQDDSSDAARAARAACDAAIAANAACDSCNVGDAAWAAARAARAMWAASDARAAACDAQKAKLIEILNAGEWV